MQVQENAMMNDLSGKVAFITGSAGGIGLGMARAFAGAGMKIAMADIDAEALNQSASELAATGAKVLAVPLDVSDEKSWTTVAGKVEAALGPVQLLCNNAGISTLGTKFEMLTPALWNKVVDINLNGVFYGIHTFLGQMRAAGGGHIVNTSSFAGLFGGVPTLAAYATTKFAIVGLSETLQAELGPEGIGVSVVCPGGVRTRLWRTSRRVRGLPDLDAPPSDGSGASSGPGNLDPDRVGLRILDAVRNGEFYVITHPEMRPAIVARHEQLMAAFDRGEAAAATLRGAAEVSETAARNSANFVSTLVSRTAPKS
jgi:NAD(P)-dependent dehydrogenase (short-subunit alcohol dehydrogenase family)